jgi:hypothetical protein
MMQRRPVEDMDLDFPHEHMAPVFRLTGFGY